MSYSTHITNRALQDMDAAASYIRFTLLNPDAAIHLLVKAREDIDSLADFPKRNPLVDDPILSSWGVRFIVIQGYLAFYVVSEEDKRVHVIRFLHGRRDWIQILKQDFTLK